MSVYSIGQPKTKSLRELFPFIHFSGSVKEVTCRKGIVHIWSLSLFHFQFLYIIIWPNWKVTKWSHLFEYEFSFLLTKRKFSWILGILLFHFSIHLPKIFSLNKSGARSIAGVGPVLPESRSNEWHTVWGRMER